MDNSNGSKGTPVAAEKPAGRRCRYCNTGALRRSRLRLTDAPWLLLLQWPVRCLRCSKRQYVLSTTAAQALSSRTPHAPDARAKESWQTFTAGEYPTRTAASSAPNDEGDRS